MTRQKSQSIKGKETPEWHEPLISIGTAAKKTGLSASAIRKYEREGLLLLFRTTSGRRLLSQADVNRIMNIQHLVNRLGLNMEGIRRLLAILPCWKMKPCSPKQRDNCPAYVDCAKPCWMLAKHGCADAGNHCRDCAVYRQGVYFADDIKPLLHPEARFPAGLH